MEISVNMLRIICAQRNLRGQIRLTERRTLPLREGSFGDAEGMAAQMAAAWPDMLHILQKSVVAMLINIGKTAFRIAPATVYDGNQQECPAGIFPRNASLNEQTHVFSCAAYAHGGETQTHLLAAALPTALASALTHFCRVLGISVYRITCIDTLENALVRHYTSLFQENQWLCIPQEKGLRIVTLRGQIPASVYCINDDFAAGKLELTRLWCAQRPADIPARAWLFYANKGFTWLRAFLSGENVTVSDTEPPDDIYCRITERSLSKEKFLCVK
jgi:hypothetical protein